MKFLAVVVILTIAGISCEAGKIKGRSAKLHKGGKCGKMALVPQECLKPEVADTVSSAFNTTHHACFMEALNKSGVAPTTDRTKHNHEHHEAMKNWFKENKMCMRSCTWQKLGLINVTDGVAAISTAGFMNFTSTLIDDASKVLTMVMNYYAEKKGLSLTVQVGEKCEGLKKHFNSFKKSIEVACNPEKRAAILSGTLDMSASVTEMPGSTSSYDEEDDMDMNVSSTSSPY